MENTRKTEIIQVSYKLFITKGYEETSIDEIILQVGIAKGTFYYYFKSKEELLESVVEYTVNSAIKNIEPILKSKLSLEEKFYGVIMAVGPKPTDIELKDVLHLPENIIIHKKLNDKIAIALTPILESLVQEGIEKGLFNTTNIHEKVKMLSIIANTLFDDTTYEKESIPIFIELVEDMLGAKKGTLSFIGKVIER